MISIVIPIFNEQETLPILFERLTNAATLWGEPYEVVLVDDGSSDRSLSLMLECVKKSGHFRVVKLSRNFGHQGAVSAGLAHARGDAVIITDGDLQDPPEQIPKFLEQWRAGYDVVYAIRTKRKEGLLKRTAYSVFYRFLSMVSEIEIPLDSGDFCLLDRKVVDVLKHELPENIRFVRGLRAFAGFRQVGVSYERDARAAGKPKYSFVKLVKLATDGLFGFSTLPLRLATYSGFSISLLSLLAGGFYLVQRIYNFPLFGRTPSETPGFASLVISLFFLSGVILLFLGVLGEYVGRIYIEVKQRPCYIVDSVYGRTAEARGRKRMQRADSSTGRSLTTRDRAAAHV